MRAPDFRRTWSTAIAGLLALVATTACERSLPTIDQSPTPNLAVVSTPVSDRVMGSLSGLARHVSLAMQDPAVRGAVVRAMKDSSADMVGLDLTNCEAGTIVHQLLAAGEKRGGSPAATVCAAVARSGGLLLYMAPDRLAAWDSTLVPIVTAVADLNAALPGSYQGYRSPTQMITVPSDGSLSGPILVVVPLLHPKRYHERPPHLLASKEIRVLRSLSDTGRVRTPNLSLTPP